MDDATIGLKPLYYCFFGVSTIFIGMVMMGWPWPWPSPAAASRVPPPRRPRIQGPPRSRWRRRWPRGRRRPPVGAGAGRRRRRPRWRRQGGPGRRRRAPRRPGAHRPGAARCVCHWGRSTSILRAQLSTARFTMLQLLPMEDFPHSGDMSTELKITRNTPCRSPGRSLHWKTFPTLMGRGSIWLRTTWRSP